jgi:hypothetical protein
VSTQLERDALRERVLQYVIEGYGRTAIAAMCDATRKDISAIFADRSFKEEVREELLLSRAAFRMQLRHATELALGTMVELLTEGNAFIKLKAAQDLLDRGAITAEGMDKETDPVPVKLLPADIQRRALELAERAGHVVEKGNGRNGANGKGH